MISREERKKRIELLCAGGDKKALEQKEIASSLGIKIADPHSSARIEIDPRVGDQSATAFSSDVKTFPRNVSREIQEMTKTLFGSRGSSGEMRSRVGMWNDTSSKRAALRELELAFGDLSDSLDAAQLQRMTKWNNASQIGPTPEDLRIRASLSGPNNRCVISWRNIFADSYVIIRGREFSNGTIQVGEITRVKKSQLPLSEGFSIPISGVEKCTHVAISAKMPNGSTIDSGWVRVEY